MTPILYLYAVVEGEPAVPLGEGIAGEPLRWLPVGGVGIVAGELTVPPQPFPEILQRQDAVVQRLAGLFAALLPARFGESAADEATLAAKLAPRERELAEALKLVHGCVQMTLRVFGEPDAAPEPRLRSPADPGPASSKPAAASRRGCGASPRSIP